MSEDPDTALVEAINRTLIVWYEEYDELMRGTPDLRKRMVSRRKLAKEIISLVRQNKSRGGTDENGSMRRG